MCLSQSYQSIYYLNKNVKRVRQACNMSFKNISTSLKYIQESRVIFGIFSAKSESVLQVNVI